MNTKSNISIGFIIKPIVFILALLTGSYLVLKIEKCKPSDLGFYQDIFKREILIKPSFIEYPLRETHKQLTDEELGYARIAWKYFENNLNPETGLVNSVDKYNSTTIWDISSSLHAVLSAYEIGIIDEETKKLRIETTMNSMLKMKLYNGKLPNKVYNVVTLNMATYDNRPSDIGVGWSSMDIGRFLGLCYRIMHNYPQYTYYVKELQKRWDLNLAIDNATLMGIGFSFKDGVERMVQEGKLGYEQYSAKGFHFMGYDVLNAMSYTAFLKFTNIYGIQIGTDIREVRHHPSYNYILSDPYILDGLEYGFDIYSRELAYRVFKVQKRRYQNTDIITAVGEGHVDQEPWFVYNCVYVDGKTWHCVSESGEDSSDLKTFSTGAAFGWYYLFDDEYSEILKQKAKNLYHPDLGWYAGVYEKTGEINETITANVNAMVLQALNYRIGGRLNG